MPACYIWKCECGIEWKTVRNMDGKKQVHVCMCKRRHNVPGVITHLFYSRNPQQTLDQLWDEVPRSKFREHLTKSDRPIH
jgi:hypothetical protein